MQPFLIIAAYTSLQDLGLGNFVLVRLANPKLYLVWMGKVESKVVKDEHCKNFKHFHIQWWVLVKKGTKNDRELYWDCWVNKWKCNLADPKQWVDISSNLFSFLAKNHVTINSIIVLLVLIMQPKPNKTLM
jgi:threonine/homoserine/homoserine lactone efflux protein